MTAPSTACRCSALAAENETLRRELQRERTRSARTAIELRARLADAQDKLREIDLMCEASWLNIAAYQTPENTPEGFGNLVLSVNEVQEVLHGGLEPVREVFHQAFLDQLDKRDAAVAVFADIDGLAETNDDPQLHAALSKLPREWAEQVTRRQALTRTGDAGTV